MTICIINNLYPPLTRGGAEQVVAETVKGLRNLGHKVIVITASPEETKQQVEGSCVIYRYHPRNIFFYTDARRYGVTLRMLWHIINAFHFGSARFVNRVLLEERPDVVHTHNLMGLGFLIPMIIRRREIRHVHTVHDVQLVEPSGIIRKKKEHSFRYAGVHVQLWSAVTRALFGSPDVVISPSQFLLRFYEARGFFSKSRRIVLRNPSREPSKRPLRLPHDGVQMLYLGQIEEHKGVLFLLKAFQAITKQYSHLTLHIVGGGFLLDEVRRIAGGDASVVVHGFVPHDELPDLFAHADAVVVPSLCYENSPTVIFESFSFGVPVLASRVEGIAELITEGKNGLMFETENASALIERLIWCATHREELRDMGNAIVRTFAGSSLHEYLRGILGLYK